MPLCACGNKDGSNLECELCQFTTQVRSDMKLIRDAYNHIMDLRDEIASLRGTPVVSSAVADRLKDRVTPQVVSAKFK